MIKTITVSSAVALQDALAKSTGGETILLKGGDYGHFSLGAKTPYNFKWPSEVTIASADPLNPAKFTGVGVSGATNLTFDGIRFDYAFKATDDQDARPFSFANCANLTIRDSTFDGASAKGVGGGAEGNGWAVGLSVRWSKGVTIENNEIYDFKRGLILDASSAAVIKGNNVHSIRSDGMDFTQVDGVRIEDNWIHDFRSTEGTGDHRDMIQFWTTGTTKPSQNIVIQGNLLDIGDGVATQSIFMRNELVDTGTKSFGEMAYRNVLIEENVIINSHLHGITVGETAGLAIRNNSVLHADGRKTDGIDDGVEIPRIRVAAKSAGVVVEKNLTSAVDGYSTQPGWKVAGNVIVQDQNPSAPGWYGNVFVESTIGAHDFVALPGSEAALSGAGATVTRIPEADGVLPQFHVTQGSIDGATRTFDARYTLGTDGTMVKGAVFVWTFGDGTTAKGDVVSHSFADGGRYGVTLSVRLPDGSTSTTATTVGVDSPEIASFKAGQNFVIHDEGTTVAIKAAALTAAGLTLGGAGVALTIPRDRIARLEGADEFDINFALRAASKTGAGEVFRLHPGLIASVGSTGEVSLLLYHENGSKTRLSSLGAHLLDGKTHDVSISYDDGKLFLAVDGKTPVSIRMPMPIDFGDRGLEFGSALSKNHFKGVVTAFEIVQDASDYPLTATTQVLIETVRDVALPPKVAPVEAPAVIADEEVEDVDGGQLLLSFASGEAGFTAYNDEAAVRLAGGAPPDGLHLGAKGAIASVAQAHLREIFGAESFDIGFGIKAASASFSGEIFRVHGSFIVSAGADGEVRFKAFHKDGSVTTLITSGADLGDTRPHDVSIRYDDGILSVTVDGAVLARGEMDLPLTSSGRHGLTFGNPWGRENFKGVLSAFDVSVDEPGPVDPVAIHHLADAATPGFLADQIENVWAPAMEHLVPLA